MPSEQELVSQFFSGRPRGYFVEVGANEPELRSQTWHLERSGWTGALIEPQPDLAEVLRATRRACVFEAACSSPENAGRKLPLHVAGPLSSLNRETMAPGATPHRVIAVPVRTLDDILEEAGAPARIDLLSIDVEGHEIEVLSGFDIRKWRPRLVLLEDHVGCLTRHRMMRKLGYRIVKRYDSNGWYVPNTSPFRPSIPDRIEIFRKYYLALPVRKARNFIRKIRGLLPDTSRPNEAVST